LLLRYAVNTGGTFEFEKITVISSPTVLPISWPFDEVLQYVSNPGIGVRENEYGELTHISSGPEN